MLKAGCPAKNAKATEPKIEKSGAVGPKNQKMGTSPW